MNTKEFDLFINNIRLRCYLSKRNDHLPMLIFLHELFGCIRHWRDFPDRLGEATGLSTLVYDRQGYGMSDPFSISKRSVDYLEKEAEVLHTVIETLNIPEVILFGHSDGGSIALLAAAKFPGKIRGVITEGAHVFVEDITREGIQKAEELYRNSNLKEKLACYHGDKTEMVFRLWADTWLSEEYRDWNIEHFLKKIHCPVLVIQGKNDEYGTIGQVESIQHTISGCSLVCMPDAGHTPHREVPQLIIEVVKEFLGAVYAGSAHRKRGTENRKIEIENKFFKI